MNAPATAEVPADITITIGEAKITIPGEVAVMAYLERMLEDSRPKPFPFATPARDAGEIPKIGDAWHGGIYAGLTVHENQPMALVLLPGELESSGWQSAKDWAVAQGGELPSRVDALILFQNLKSEFKESYYWTGEQFAGHSDYAWSQYFSNGNQFSWRKDYDYRARAVRRLVIQ